MEITTRKQKTEKLTMPTVWAGPIHKDRTALFLLFLLWASVGARPIKAFRELGD